MSVGSVACDTALVWVSGCEDLLPPVWESLRNPSAIQSAQQEISFNVVAAEALDLPDAVHLREVAEQLRATVVAQPVELVVLVARVVTPKVCGVVAAFRSIESNYPLALLCGELAGVTAEQIVRAGVDELIFQGAPAAEALPLRLALAVARYRKEGAFRRAREGAAATSARTMKLLATMSHEMRTPLTALLGYADLIAENEATRPRQQSLVRSLLASGNHLLQLLNDILELSRAGVGKRVFSVVACDAKALVEDVAALFHGRAREKGLKLHVTADDHVPRGLRTDVTAVKQVLVNLVGNAVKYTPEGEVEITVSYDAPEERLAFAVRDTGPGLDTATQRNLFQPFFRGEDREAIEGVEGTGLGLAISKRLARQLGGDISCVSRVGNGATFTFWVTAAPVGDLSSDADETGDVAPVDEPLAPELLAPTTALVVDDSQPLRRFITLVLQEYGLTVREAADGQAALRWCEEDHIDFVLMDLNMPVLGGLETARRLRSQRFPGVLVAMTGETGEHVRQEALDAGFHAYLTKPFWKATLQELLMRLYPPLASRTTVVAAHKDFFATLSPEEREELFRELARNLQNELSVLRTALQSEDIAAVRTLAHKMKGAAAYGLPQVAAVAAQTEEICCTGIWALAEPLGRELEHEMSQALLKFGAGGESSEKGARVTH